MRKLFLAICFSFYFCSFTCWAAVKSVSSVEEAKINSGEKKMQLSQEALNEKEYFRNMSPEQMRQYLNERLFHVVINELDDSAGLGGDGAINIQKSELQQAIEAQNKKSIFEKIYDRAMNNLINTTAPKPAAKIYTDDKISQKNMRPSAVDEMEQNLLSQQQAWYQKTGMIDVELPPYNKKTLVPAQEHIPFLFSRIELLPDGLVKVTDTIVVVANGEKVKNSIQRAFPKYVFDREGNRQKVEFNLLGVSINGSPAEYKLSDRNNFVFMEPAQKLQLIPGVYEYQFEYIVDNQIFSYDEFDEFYWNLTGSVWNLVIASAGASVILPPNTQTLGQTALSGYNNYWRDDTVNITQEQENVLGFVSKTPLFIGQALELIVSLPKGAVSNFSWSQRFLRFINAYGDVLFAICGLFCILTSYIISLYFIQKKQKRTNLRLSKDAPLFRYLAKGVIDKKSFGAFILDLYRKNIVDIEENDQNILLIKKTDNLKSLSKTERKVIQTLFNKGEDILNINSFSLPKIQKAMSWLHKSISKKINILNLKLNSQYLFFSIGMLIFTEVAISFLNYDFGYNFLFLFSTTLSLVFALWLFQIKCKQNWKNKLVKTSAIFWAAATIFVMMAIVNLYTALIISAALVIIQEYSKIYVQRDGLLAAFIKDAQDLAVLLQTRVDAFSLGHDFINNQAAIFALDCEELYVPCARNSAVYKLDIMKKLIAKI